VNYTPSPSVVPFLTGQQFVELILGPVGSTKTTAALMKIVYEAKRMAPCKDGIRRSRCAWIRNTREQLRDTSIPDFLKLFPDGIAGDFTKTEYRFRMKFDDVECEVLFRGLDDANDVRRLLSLQLSFAVLEEFREINPEIYKGIQGRVKRYPDKSMVPHRPEWGLDEKGHPIGGCVDEDGKPMGKVWGASNPPDLDTFWEELISNPPENVHVTLQPGALSPEADWLQFLAASYYEDLMKSNDQDWVDVYIHSKFGKSLSGKPVFRAFNRDVHIAKQPLKFQNATNNPLIIGFDCGLTPTAVLGQIDYTGRLLVFDAIPSDGMGALRFIREKLKPLLASKYPMANVLVVMDSAGDQRAQTDERTVRDMFIKEGLACKATATNNITARISAVDSYLTRMVDGKPGILIDPGCHQLIMALAGKYRYKINSKGETEPKPDKNHPYSDLADALQYLCLHTDGGRSVGFNMGHGRPAVPIHAATYAYL